MHLLVKLAKRTVENYIRRAVVIDTPKELPEDMRLKRGVFVSIKKHGELRGCIGTIQPETGCVAEETIRNAIYAATHDHRFPPVREEELNELDYSVDVLCPPEAVKGMEGLDPKRYGVIVSKGARKGLLLPDLEGVSTEEEQLHIAKLKAGIDPEDKDVQVERFEVKRYK